MPPGLPCRRSRRQSDTIPNGTGVPTPSGPHDRSLHLNPPPLFPSPCSLWFAFFACPPCPPWFAFSPCPPCRVRCGAGFLACGRLSSRPGCPLLTATPAPNRTRRQVEQAARLAMPAVTSAEQHTRHTYGISECRPARAPPRSTSTRPLFSYLRVLCTTSP